MNAPHGSTGGPARSLALLWGVRERVGRKTRSDLSLAKIVAAAVELADGEGLTAVSMRRVAEHLGVGTMTLYTYVPGKTELVVLMLDACYGEISTPDDVPGGWRGRLEHVARENWDLCHRHPWILQASTARPVLGPNAVAKYDYELRAVDGIGLSEVEMDLVVNLVTGHVEGAARRGLDAVQVEQSTGMTDGQWWEANAPLLRTVVDPARFPTAAKVGEVTGEVYGAAYAPERAFDFGLRRVLDGIEAFVLTRTGPQGRKEPNG